MRNVNRQLSGATASAGTDWDNLAPSSENIRHVNQSGGADWVDFGYDADADDVVQIADTNAMAFVADGTGATANPILRYTKIGLGGSVSPNTLVTAYVKPVVSTNPWCLLSVSQTALGGVAHGGGRFFDLDNGVAGIFDQTGTGTSIDYGIETVIGGFLIWSLVNCGGDATGGLTMSWRPVKSEAFPNNCQADFPNPVAWVTGYMCIVGPSGLTEYIPTSDVA